MEMTSLEVALQDNLSKFTMEEEEEEEEEEE